MDSEASHSGQIPSEEPPHEADATGEQLTEGTSKKRDRMNAKKAKIPVASNSVTDIIMWRQRRVSCGIIIVASSSWILIERSGISFLSLWSDVLLVLVILLFLRANFAIIRKRQPKTLPELVLSEEMVTNAATSFRVKVNYMLLMAHDITLGKDFRLFFKVVIALWLISVIGSLTSFFTLAYIGIIISITVPAFYDRFKDTIDRHAGKIHRKFSKNYKIVDESLHNRLPRAPLTKDKDS